jgi:hypothetical protein
LRSVFLVSLFAGLCCLSGSLQSQVKALPLHSRSPVQQFPRIFGLASKGMQDRVNVVLADREQMDLESRRDCLHTHLSQLRATYDETIRLTYLSSSLLSIDVRSTRIGCDAYPNIDMSYPLTIDLTSGKPLIGRSFSKKGFWMPRMVVSLPSRAFTFFTPTWTKNALPSLAIEVLGTTYG